MFLVNIIPQIVQQSCNDCKCWCSGSTWHYTSSSNFIDELSPISYILLRTFFFLTLLPSNSSGLIDQLENYVGIPAKFLSHSIIHRAVAWIQRFAYNTRFTYKKKGPWKPLKLTKLVKLSSNIYNIHNSCSALKK